MNPLQIDAPRFILASILWRAWYSRNLWKDYIAHIFRSGAFTLDGFRNLLFGSVQKCRHILTKCPRVEVERVGKLFVVSVFELGKICCWFASFLFIVFHLIPL